MNRVDLQHEVANAIEKARAAVKSRKGLRVAMRVGAYRVGNRVFASLDGETAFEVKGSERIALTSEEFSKYVRPENDLTMSFEFSGIALDTLNALLAMFREVAAN
jgi:hypothetical protein